MNPYQRVIVDGALLQTGHIDTQAKFAQLVEGIDLAAIGSAVDVGCNVGMMSKLLRDAGVGWVLGIDERYDYVQSARRLWPGIPGLGFDCRPAAKLCGRYDLGILSAVYHYLQDPRPALRQLSRCCEEVRGDVWLNPRPGPAVRVCSGRGLWVPNEEGFLAEVAPFFGVCEIRDRVPSPDDSDRWAFRLARPIRQKPKALLIYGKGGAGKTTYALSFFDRERLHFDQVHVERWAIGHHNERSILRYHELLDVNEEERARWLEYNLGYFARWLRARVNLDLVIEGYDLTDEDLRMGIAQRLDEEGYDVEEATVERPDAP